MDPLALYAVVKTRSEIDSNGSIVDKGNCEETNEPEPSPKHGYRKTKTATAATDTPHSFETYPVSK
jgi:hypothetical protein